MANLLMNIYMLVREQRSEGLPLDVYIFLVYFITVELLCDSVCVYESVHECV